MVKEKSIMDNEVCDGFFFFMEIVKNLDFFMEMWYDNIAQQNLIFLKRFFKGVLYPFLKGVLYPFSEGVPYLFVLFIIRIW